MDNPFNSLYELTRWRPGFATRQACLMDAGPPVLLARLLGPMDLRFGERQLPPLDSARAESLLAYLLLHRDVPQPQQRLAFLLWPDSAEAQAHTNLRKACTTCTALRDADRLIDAGPRTLRWRPDTPLWLDVEQFEPAVAGGQLEEAVRLYAGELLEGRYDEWLAGGRERLTGLHADALERLARQHEHDRRWPEAIRCAERLVAHDPLREESHRLLIGLCQASGNRAVRAYHACATALERELGIAPSPGTRAVYESLVTVPPRWARHAGARRISRSRGTLEGSESAGSARRTPAWAGTSLVRSAPGRSACTTPTRPCAGPGKGRPHTVRPDLTPSG